MKQKICIVTGVNRGIGKGIAEAIAKQGHKAILVCRNTVMGSKVLESLQQSYGETSTELVEGDLSSIKEVKALGDNLLNKSDQIELTPLGAMCYSDIVFYNKPFYPTKDTWSKKSCRMIRKKEGGPKRSN